MNGASIEQLPPAYGRVVLIRGNCEFTVQDILAHGWFSGELRASWNELMNGVAYEERASELDLAPDDEVLNSMSEEFRYARDLLTVEETERWLLARDLTEDDFSGYLVRRYWQDNPPETATPDPPDYLTSSAELRELLRVDLLFSGKFDDLTRALSWRLAAAVELNQTEADADLAKDQRTRFFERSGLDELSLSEVRLPLTLIKIQTLSLRSREAAQEAVLCLTADQVPPEQLAQECGVCWEEQELFLGDFPADVQQEFLSAAPGEVLAPRPGDEEFVVTRMIAKTEPVLLDDQVRDRIDHQLLESHFSELCSKHIRWALGGPVH
jgi:hypothetical protein